METRHLGVGGGTAQGAIVPPRIRECAPEVTYVVDRGRKDFEGKETGQGFFPTKFNRVYFLVSLGLFRKRIFCFISQNIRELRNEHLSIYTEKKNLPLLFISSI